MPRKGTCMHKWSIRIALMALAIVTTLAAADRASAAGVVLIDACQTLSTANTVYKLTADLHICNDCLVVANDKITIDLQGHSIRSICGNIGGAVVNLGDRDAIVVKNGSVNGFLNGVDLGRSTRASVLGVTATNNGGDHGGIGISVGAQSLVKSSEVSGSAIGIFLLNGARGQVQQCNAWRRRRPRSSQSR